MLTCSFSPSLPTGYNGKIGCPNLLPRVKSQDSGTLSSARGTRALNLNAAFTTKELVRLFTRLSRRKSILSAQILLKKKKNLFGLYADFKSH